MQGGYRLLGANASPYSMKMRALLRYRRIPFVWEPASPQLAEAFRAVRPAVVPVLHYPDGHYANDSTLLAHDLEQRHPDQRSVMPDDPGTRFVSDLLEDFADEWLTKCMFHYRWWYAPDRRFASLWVVGDRFAGAATMPAINGSALAGDPRADTRNTGPGNPVSGPVTAGELDREIERFHDRQVSRMALVGVTEANKPLVEASYEMILSAFEDGILEQPFLFGSRPSLADFAWYGQFWPLAMDPTPAGVMRSISPRLLPWLLRIDDASGVEGAWRPDGSRWSTRLLELAGSIYLPFLSANLTALEAGTQTVSVELLGHPYNQTPFKYQGKCYLELRSKFAALPADARDSLKPLLERTGCLPFLR